MNKEELIAMGLSAEVADKVLASHRQAVDGNYIPRHRFDEVNTDAKSLRDQIKERDKQIADLKKFEGTNVELSDKIKVLEEANKNATTEYQSKLATERKRNAIKMELLQDADGKPHDADMVMGLFNLDQVLVEEATGKITGGFKEQRDNLRKEKAFLFNQTTNPAAPKPNGFTPVGKPPVDGDGSGAASDPSISFGKGLAAVKLGMMGVAPTGTTGTNPK